MADILFSDLSTGSTQNQNKSRNQDAHPSDSLGETNNEHSSRAAQRTDPNKDCFDRRKCQPPAGHIVKAEPNDRKVEPFRFTLKDVVCHSGETLKDGASVFFAILLKISPVLAANIFFMWIFYIPTITLSPDMLSGVKDIIYNKILSLLWAFTFWASVSTTSIIVFGIYFSWRAVILAFVPAFLKDVIVTIFVITRTSVINNASNFSTLLFISLGHYLIYTSPKPKHVSLDDIHFKLKIDGTVSALLKGLIWFYVLVILVFYNILSIYLDSSFFIQLFFRLVLFPVCFFICQSAQARTLTHLSQEHMDTRLIVCKLCNHYIQFVGRIFISNLSTDSALSIAFIFTNITSSAIGFVSALSFSYRMRLLYKFQRMVNEFVHKAKHFFLRGNRLVPIIPAADTTAGSISGVDGTQINGLVCSEQDTFIKDAQVLRFKFIRDDIVSEVYSIILAPMLMYFMHSLVQTESFQPIQSFVECFYQIVVQLLIEISFDIVVLGIETRKGNIEANLDQWNPISSWILFLWTVLCVLNIHGVLLSYA